MLYLILKWIHVLLAITALGANFTYGIWLARGRRNPEHMAFVLRGVKILDDRVANPAYGFLLITGVALTFVGGLPLTTPWIVSALVLYAIVVVLAAALYSPTLRKQVQLAEAGKRISAEADALARRNTQLGIVLAILAIGIVLLMVVKPALWSV